MTILEKGTVIFLSLFYNFSLSLAIPSSRTLQATGENPVEISAGLLAAISGGLLSLILSYLPGVAKWWEKRPGDQKRAIMVGLLFAVSLGIYGLGCWSVTKEYFQRYVCVNCGGEGLIQIIEAFIMALIANQATFQITPTKKK